MDTSTKQQKSSNRVKDTIKKLSKFVISRALYFALGICIAITVSVAYAAIVTWPAPQVSSGNTLTADLWNTFAENLDDLNNRTTALESGLQCVTKTSTCDGDCGVTTAVCDAGYLTVSCSGYMGNPNAARGTRINANNSCSCWFWDLGVTTNTCQNRCCR